MTRNNTLNKVHVAVTELPQLLSQNTNVFGEATAFAAPKLTEEIKLLELKWARAIECCCDLKG